MPGHWLKTLLIIFTLSISFTGLAQEKTTQTLPLVTTNIEDPSSYHQYWKNTSLFQYLSTPDNTLHPWALLQFEFDLARHTLVTTYTGWRTHLDNHPNDQAGAYLNHYQSLINTIFTLLFASLIFVVCLRLAKRSRLLLVRISDFITSKTSKQGWAKALVHFFNAMAPLAPWGLLWLVLNASASLMAAGYPVFNHWWLPLAKLYIVYELLCLLSEWLLLRISTHAGVFLGGEQSKQLRVQARYLSGGFIGPWVALFIIHHGLGASFSYRLVEALAWFIVWATLAALINVRQKDYLTNIKQLFPKKTDPIFERISTKKWITVLTPLLLPLQLLQFLLQYLNQLFMDFDWYRRLSARWFRMRTKVLSDSDEETPNEEDVPQQYERWFSSQEMNASGFPIIPTGLLEAIHKPVNAWLNQRTDENALVVTGEKGIGKTAALSSLQQSLQETNSEVMSHRIAVPAKTTSKAAVHQLIGDVLGIDLVDDPATLAHTDEQRPPTLLILDEAHNLFLSDIEHLEGWRALLNLINVRVNNLFWIVSINNQSWAYLCNVFGREYQIRNAIYAKRWSQNEIRSLILSRNHLSGYKIRYDDILLSSRGSDTGNLRNTEQRYFSLLWDSCRGVPMTALEMWLSSVHTDGRTVTVGLPQVPDSSILEKLGSKLMFVYAAIVTHENLTFEEILQTTHQQENVVRYALKSALDAEFIKRNQDGRYRITPLWYHTVINYLTRKNMLNE